MLGAMPVMFAGTVAACAASFLLALILTPALGALSRKAGWLDWPDESRKQHPSPVPLSGGATLLIAVLAGHFLDFAPKTLPGEPLLILSIALVFLAGMADDLAGLPVWTRLVAQTSAAALAVGSGLRIGEGWLGAAATVFWLLVCTNALNLVDGIDGLAPMVSIFGAGAMLLMGNAPARLLVPLIGALAGFVWFNLPPARIYLGDSGSLTIGFILGCAAVMTTGGVPRFLLAPALALSLPLFDTAWAVMRRIRGRKPLFTGDRGHVHHRVLEQTGSARAALALLSAVSFGGCMLAVALDVLVFRSKP